MTDTGEGPRPQTTRDAGPGALVGKRRRASAVHEVCPYLRADDASWRSAYASGEHRCAAVQPPARLTARKQRSLCLLPSHTSCATFVAARGMVAESTAGSPGGETGSAELWPETRSTLLLLEPTPGRLGRVGWLAGGPARAGGQAMLVGLMAIAFAVLVIARTATPVAPGPTDPPASQNVAVGASPATSLPQGSPTPATASPTVTPPSPSAATSAVPSATPEPSVVRYTVKPNDTLTSIAAAFGTTASAIQAANNISDPRTLRPGQVLIIP